MKALWLFILLIVFCIYVLFGLYLTESAETFVQILLTWVIYTILWTTFINVFLLGYFWSVVRTKTGPYGIRGPSGERGKNGIQGKCSLDAGQAYCIKAISEYIDNLYYLQTKTHILNEETQTFPNTYLNKKISIMASSRQYQVILANLSNDNKPVINIINYLQSIWYKWFDLLYNATSVNGSWFTDEFADENYTWSGDKNPFDEIKKYDIYYWGITREFRPLKAEVCRTSSTYTNSKFPMPNKPLSKEPRLKIIQTNNYNTFRGDRKSRVECDASFYGPAPIDIGNDSYYRVGDIIKGGDNSYRTHRDVITGEFSYNEEVAGPNMRTILVSGDVESPVSYTQTARYRGDYGITLFTPNCPKGYTDLGDVVGGYGNKASIQGIKCVPTDCVEEVYGNRQYPWCGSGNNYVLNGVGSGQLDANNTNGYNLFRGSSNKPFYKIKQSCLEKPIISNKSTTKDVEKHNSDLGIGWYGHPYKLEPQYSIFTFLNLVPEGIIVNQITGRRFYIIHYGGEEQNIYNVLDYNDNTKKYDNALEADSNITKLTIKSNSLNRIENKQQWTIVLQTDKRILKLKNIYNNKYLSVGLEPKTGVSQFSTTDANPNNVLIEQAQNFTFISTFGTNLNIIDKNTEGI